MTDADVKTAIVRKRWRVWYAPSHFNIDKWVVQRRTWYGRWKTVGRFYMQGEARNAKEFLIEEDVETFRGNAKGLK